MDFSEEITIVLFFFLVAGIFSISRSAFFFIQATHNAARGKEKHIQLNPFSILQSSNFSAQGNIYRQKFFKSFFITIFFLTACFIIGITFGGN